MALQLSSTAFGEGAPIPRRHSGDGEDLSPALNWSGIPAQARELALLMDDPDAPTSQPWVHWILYNLAMTERGLPEGVHPRPSPPFPAGSSQGKNSWGNSGYQGPAPPRGHGVHRYIFRLYALDAPLRFAPGLSKEEFNDAIRGHVLEEATLTGIYERS